jgi:hypothetical protein
MKILVTVFGCFPALRGLNAQQFINAIEPRLIDIRNPVTGLQVDMFGRVTGIQMDADRQNDTDTITAEIDIPDAFLQTHKLSPEQVREVVAGRITKLRHPATGAMARVEAQLAEIDYGCPDIKQIS